MSDADEDVLRFIRAAFPSVWALEILLALKREGRPLTRPDLVETLRASDLVLTTAVDALIAAGLASIDGVSAIYLPATQELAEQVGRAEQLYRKRPNLVRREIVGATSRSARAFADAFKLRQGRHD